MLPAFNHEAYVRFAVTSVLGQTHADLELIIIDDASSDGTWDVLCSFEDPRLRISRHAVNQGAHATINEAMATARGEYFAIINSDDVFHGERLARLIATIQASGGRSEMAFTDVEFIDPSGERAGEHARAAEYGRIASVCRTFSPEARYFAGNPAVTTSNFFFTRDLYEKVGDFSPLRYTHDWDWLMRAAQHTQIVWVDEVLLKYRVHPSNTLSEADAWRHIHENTIVQSNALVRLFGSPVDQGGDPVEICHALLANASFHPLPVLFALIELLLSSRPGYSVVWRESEHGDILTRLRQDPDFPFELMKSIECLDKMSKTVESQAELLKERWLVMDKMETMIRERDETITSQKKMIDERWLVMLETARIAAEREQTIAAQAAMLDERYQAMKEMSAEISEKSREVDRLQSDWLVRVALWLRRHVR